MKTLFRENGDLLNVFADDRVANVFPVLHLLQVREMFLEKLDQLRHRDQITLLKPRALYGKSEKEIARKKPRELWDPNMTKKVAGLTNP